MDNLRWTDESGNNNNKSSDELFDDISDDAIVADDYNGWKFEFLYFHENIFYYYNGIKYRKLHINEMKCGCLCVNVHDVLGKNRAICYNKFKYEYNL
jgi:hypothetical protein